MGMGEFIVKIKIDDGGWLALPSKIRDSLNLKLGEGLVININQNNIFLLKNPSEKKYRIQYQIAINNPVKI